MTITQSGTFVADFNQDAELLTLYFRTGTQWVGSGLVSWRTKGHHDHERRESRHCKINGGIVGVADFNQDGKPDILWQDTAGVGTVQLWSDGRFERQSDYQCREYHSRRSDSGLLLSLISISMDIRIWHCRILRPVRQTISFFGGVSRTASLGTARLSGNNP